MSPTEFPNWMFVDDLNNLLRKVRRTQSAKIDAGACQTHRDYDAAHKAEDEEADAIDAFTNKWAPKE